MDHCSAAHHICGKRIVIKFDNLVQNHPFIVGKTIPVLALAFPCQLGLLNKIGKNANKAAERFNGRLK
jgi:hypothetical protein